MNNCKNCNFEISGNFCSNCGNPIKLKRIDGHYIIHEIEHVLHFEKGILHTVKELLLKPGASVKEFLSENRVRLVKPIIFIIITSLVYSLIIHYFHIKEEYVTFNEEGTSTTGLIFVWFKAHYGYFNILAGLFIALWTKVFFRKSGYNYFEILILLCFVTGCFMLILSVFSLVQGLTHIQVVQYGGIIGIVYTVWAIGQFFGKSKALNYVKACFAYVLGLTTLSFSALLIGG